MKRSASIIVMMFLAACLVIVPLSSLAASAPQATPPNEGSLDLYASTGPIGATVLITGFVTEGITNLDTSCSISSPTDPSIVMASACVVNGYSSTSGNFTGSFTVGNVSPGEYVIEVTACPGNNGCWPSRGDFVQAIFLVAAPGVNTCCAPTIEIPDMDFPPGSGQNVQVFGSGFSLSDGSCTFVVGGLSIPAGGDSCIIQGGHLTGVIFAAGLPALPPGYYMLEAIGAPTGDTASTNIGI